MLKFFRKIRQQLITENKTGKYLKYAIGEVILVVIGILIAVQINSFYNKKALVNTNTKLLNRMIEEAELNIKRLNYLDNDRSFVDSLKSSSFEDNAKNLDSIFKILNLGLAEDNIDFIIDNGQFDKSSYNLHNSVFEEMKNTGKLYNIGSDSLINQINLYYKLIDREDNYHKLFVAEIREIYRETKHGWKNFIMEYTIDKEKAIKNNPWLFEESSLNYINLKTYILEAMHVSKRSRQRVHGIRIASKNLILSIEKELKN